MKGPLTEPQFRVLVAQFIKEQGSLRQAARVSGVDKSYLSRFQRYLPCEPSLQLAAYFGLTPTVVYVRLEKKP